jgi:RimJ/RimL family protein N-acetyltransferase
VLRLLEGNNVNLRVMEKEDVSLFAEWLNNPLFLGEFWDFSAAQRSKAEIEKTLENNPFEYRHLIVEKKDGTRIGLINHFNMLHPRARSISSVGANQC